MVSSDVIFICVLVCVASATTLVCHIFGKILAQKLARTMSNQHQYIPPKVRRKRQYSSSITDSDNSEDHNSAVRYPVFPSQDLKTPNLKTSPSQYLEQRQRKKRMKRRISRNLKTSEEEERRKKRWRAREYRRNNRPLPNFDNRQYQTTFQASGTFGRLGIPDVKDLSQKLVPFAKQLEDKNLSPLYQTPSDTDSEYNKGLNPALNRRRLSFYEQTPSKPQSKTDFDASKIVSLIPPRPRFTKTGSDSVFLRNGNLSKINEKLLCVPKRDVVIQVGTENKTTKKDVIVDIGADPETESNYQSANSKPGSQAIPDLVNGAMGSTLSSQLKDLHYSQCSSCGQELIVGENGQHKH